MARFIIRSRDELDAALRRVDEIGRARSNSDRERELEEISVAIRRYHKAVQVIRDAAAKAADTPEQPVDGISGAE
jgi:DNA-binding IclR family transcriptional regulator